MVVVCRSLHAVAAVCCSLCIVAVAFCSLSVAKAVRQQLRKQLFLGQAARAQSWLRCRSRLMLSAAAYVLWQLQLPFYGLPGTASLKLFLGQAARAQGWLRCRSRLMLSAAADALWQLQLPFCGLPGTASLKLFLGQAAQDTLSSLSVAPLVLSGTAYGCGSAVLPRSRLS